MLEELSVSHDSRLRRLEQLSQVTREMMSGLASLTPDALLDQIARHAVEILDAETCGVFLVRGDELSLEASYGHHPGGFPKGRRLPIQDGEGCGLTGFLAFQRSREPINLHGEELDRHPAVAHREQRHTPSGRCDSLLAINLFRKREGPEALIGLLRVDNKKGADGLPSRDLRFGREDEWILTLFADAAVVAIESAELVSQLKEQEDFKERLFGSSPDGIIAVNRQGLVTAYNPQAEEILGYPPDEVLSFPVESFYFDPEEPRRIGRMLHAGNGRVRDYETAVRNKDGERIPVRHSSTWLFDAAHERVGSVGYFEDLRRRRLLLEASNLLATADHLDQGLQKLAEMMVAKLGRAFCGILLLDEGSDTLILRAAASLRLAWKPRRGERFQIADWPGLRLLLERGRPTVRHRGDDKARPDLERFSKKLRCERPIQHLLIVPLTLEGRLVGQLTLGVLEGDAGAPFTLEERHLVSAIASQITALIDRMRLQEASRRTFRQLSVLHQIGDYIQATEDLGRILRTILTGVTASYGLGFNRAALLLLDEAEDGLIGQTGIGEISEEAARAAWRDDIALGLDDFEHYLLRLERNEIPETEVGERIRGLRLPTDGNDPLAEAVRTGKPVLVAPEEHHRLPEELRNALQPESLLVLAPLVAKKGVLGILVVDNKFTRAQIGQDLLDSLMIFVNTAAIVLENKRLFQEAVSGREKLLSYYQDSGALLGLRDPEQILRAVVEQAYRASGAWGVSILLLDEAGHLRSPIQFGKDRELRPDGSQLVRANGITAQVMRTGEAVRITDVLRERERVNPVLVQRGIGAALCLPMSLPGRQIGVLWIHYQHPRRFPDSEIGALQLYVNRAATAYNEAQRMRRFETLKEAVDALAGAEGTEDVLRQIVASARRVLEADGAVFWFYDTNARGENFVPDRSVSSGIDDAVWEPFRSQGPRRRGTAYRVMSGRGWFPMSDVENPEQAELLGETTRKFLADTGSRAFLGLALKAGQERLGVLYALYERPRRFAEEDEETARAFANHAALALKKAKLLDQLQKTKAAAKSVARLTVVGDSGGRREALERIAHQTWTALDCGAVVLFEVDPVTGHLDHPPAMIGVNHPEQARSNEEKGDYGLVGQMLDRSSRYVAPRVPDDPLFQNTRFARDEGIKSCIAVPLQAPDRKVGVMFVNYRHFRRFPDDEVETIQMLADQAAVAIRNAQLFEEQTRLVEQKTRQFERQKKLADLSRKLLGTTNPQEAMDSAVQFAAEALGVDFCNVVLRETDGRLIFRAGFGWDPDLIGEELQPGKGSQTGFTMQKGDAVRVEDFSQVEDFEVPQIVRDHDIRCGLSVPMFRGRQIVGAMLVHSRQWWHITDEDETLLRLLANDTAFAIQLFEARSLVDARTTLAIMGLSTAHWGHLLARHAHKAHREVQALRKDLSPSDLERLEDHLREIEKWANITRFLIPPRDAFEQESSFKVNEELIEQVVAQLWEIEPYRDVEPVFQLKLDNELRARGSCQWLRVALGLLVDNAIDALEDIPSPRIVFGSCKRGLRAEISVTDNGRGIPQPLRSVLLQGPPSKEGLGVGLAAVQVILQTCGGDLRFEEANPGTSMVLSLPLA